MTATYTYFKAQEGVYVGYWNDYPDYLTEGDTLAELRKMLRGLRQGIDMMVTAGDISAAAPCRSASMELA